MTLNTVLKESVKFLSKHQIENPELEIRWVLESLLNMSTTELLIKGDEAIKESDYDKLRILLERRATGEPLAYVLNEKEFYGYSFYVDSRVLIPRPETELIIDFCKESFMASEDIKAMDMGTGSGCLSVSLAKEFENLKITSVDVSEAALEVAKQNVEFHEVDDRVTLKCADVNALSFVEPFESGSFDLVVANPPYIDFADEQVQKEVKEFEPHLALYAEDNGLESIKKWLAHADYLLRSGGFLFFEIGAEQKDVVLEFLRQMNSFESFECYQDLSERDRVIYAKKR